MIIDTHTHFYDPSRPQGIPWPGEDSELYRQVLPEHHRDVSGKHGVTGTVVVEASSWIDDNQWILDLAADDPWIVGFVGHVDPNRAGFGADIERFAANPLFRGIRIGCDCFGDLDNGHFMADMELLAGKGLELDVLMNVDHWDNFCEFARRVPELTIVINHIALVPVDGNAPDPHWVDCMNRAAEFPRVFMKGSGVVETTAVKPAPADPGYYEPTLDGLWNAFGEDRILYGSNWPVSDLHADFGAAFGIVKTYFEGKGEEQAQKYWWRNAEDAYGFVARNS
jgi:L-fuconolactonase